MDSPFHFVPSRTLRVAAYGIALVTLGAVSFPTASALESSTVGDNQGTQAVVSTVNMKVDALAAAVSETIGPIVTCNKARKFYAPADPRKDANGCVGIQDYDVATTNSSLVNASGSRSNEFMGRYINSAASLGYGVMGQSTSNGYGVYGLSTTSWSGVFDGGTTGYGALGQGVIGIYGVGTAGASYGVYGTTTLSNGWAGVFNSGASTGGVSIDNTTHNANLCLNGVCTKSLGTGKAPTLIDVTNNDVNNGGGAPCATAGNNLTLWMLNCGSRACKQRGYTSGFVSEYQGYALNGYAQLSCF